MEHARQRRRISWMKVESLKVDKRKMKSAITKQLNELAGRVNTTGSPEEMEEIKATLERLEELKEKTFEILEELPSLYQEQKNIEMQIIIIYKSGTKRMG